MTATVAPPPPTAPPRRNRLAMAAIGVVVLAFGAMWVYAFVFAPKNNPDKLERAFAFKTNIRIGAAVRKGNEELLMAVRDAIQALQANGTQKRLLEKNGMDPTLIVPAEILR